MRGVQELQSFIKNVAILVRAVLAQMRQNGF